MPLLDLSRVTKTLTNVIEQSLTSSPEAPQYTPFTVLPSPPDKLSGAHAVGLYLYHAEEHPTFKNQVAPGSDQPAIQYTPLGLNLYYQLTAHSDIPDSGAEIEQLMMGLSMKALHDYACLDDQTKVGAFTVFPPEIRGNANVFRIILQPVLPAEAPHYWTAASQPLRFAAYYQVSVAFMEPEPVVQRPSRVLGFGVYGFSRGTPFLEGSKSAVTFTMPGEIKPRIVTAQPAEAPVNGKITFFGTGLSGNPTTLLLRNQNLPGAVEVGVDWGVSATDSTIVAVIQPFAGSSRILPGIYSGIARVTEQKIGPDKKPKSFGNTSNETPFIVTPRIDTIIQAAALVTVTGGIFQDVAILPAQVQVLVGSFRLQPKAGALLNPGEFETTNPATLRFLWPTAGFNSGDTVPVRICINGAENAPAWVTAP